MIMRCAWCSKFRGLRRPFLDFSVTHGACSKCFKEIIGKKKPDDCKSNGLNKPQGSDLNVKHSIKRKKA